MMTKARSQQVTRKKKQSARTSASTTARKPAAKPLAPVVSKALVRKPSPPASGKAKAKAKTKAKSPVSATTTGTQSRRAIFIDVENTSSEAELMRVLGELKIDLTDGATQVAAIGNWRMVGQQLGRSLAQLGAQLVHSAPAARVPDWSDLWIAVQAGISLGRSRPGDTIEIVSHDRAFDAVGDAAAQLGVVFRRITYRSAGASAVTSDGATSAERQRSEPSRRRRRGGRSAPSGAATLSPALHAGRGSVAPTPQAAREMHRQEPDEAEPLEDESRHGASPQQLHAIIARLVAANPARTVTLDALTVALKAAGFQRPPGSPRLVTRLRQVKGVEFLGNGKLRLSDDGSPSPLPALGDTDREDLRPDTPGSEDGVPGTEGERERRPRRRGRRGGRGRAGAVNT